MSTQPAHEPLHRLPVRLLIAVAALLVLGFSVTTIPGFRSTPTFHDGYDG
jgi:hypothetical protein